MAPDRMSRNDFILLAVFGGMLFALVLVAFAPVGDEASFTVRVWAAASSPISIALVGTFIAAFAGTWGAQLLAERTAVRRALLSEIRGTVAALGLVFGIVNTYVVTKKQHIRALVHNYEAQALAREAHHAGGRPDPFHCGMDLEPTLPPYSPLDELLYLFREKISPDGKALILLTPLMQCIHGFADISKQRNAWIEEVRAMPAAEEALQLAMFFGIPYAPGRVDDRYPNFIRGLKAYTDDCIAFGLLLGQALTAYAERQVQRYGEGAPKIPKPNFDEAGDLIPDMEPYAGWMKN